MLILVAMFLSAAVIVFTLRQIATEARYAHAGAAQDNDNLSHALAEHVLNTFTNADELVWSIKQQVERHGLPDDLRALLAERTVPDTPVLLAHITDPSGTTIRHTHSDKALHIAHRVHFRAHVQEDLGRLVLGEPMLGVVSGKWTVHVSRRINRTDGSFGGVVTAALDQGYFSRFYDQVKHGSAGFVMLVGRDGIVRAQDGRATDTVGARMQSAELQARLARSDAGSYVTRTAGGQIDRFVSFRALEQYPLVVVVASDAEQALAQHYENRSDYIVGAGVIIALVWTGVGLLGWIHRRQRRIALQLEQANERAEAANRMKSDFLANMTHELRTPLNGIIGFADCLQDELEDRNQRESARVIYTSGCTLLGMVNAVLDMAKIEAGKMEVHARSESVGLMLDELLGRYAAAAQCQGLVLRVDVSADVPAEIDCDRARVLQVLTNLIENALRFTATGRIVLAARLRGDTVAFAVRDTGCGIRPALLEAIGQRFAQDDEHGVGLRGGTGLGLALSCDLARLMGGRMEVESQPGRGSEFRLVLPLGRAY